MARSGKKDFPLSITVKAVDKATGPMGRMVSKMQTAFAPLRATQAGLASGFTRIQDGMKGVGGIATSLAKSFAVIGGAAAAAGIVFKRTVDQFDNLGDAAERIGVSVDALAGLRFAAEQSGASTEDLDSALGGLNKQLGLARAKTGKLYGFLGKVSPTLRKQVLATGSAEEAFGVLADAIVKVEDPTKRAALAAQVFGGSGAALVPLLAKGSKGVAALRAEHLRLAGPLGEAAERSGAFNDQLSKTDAAMTGVKAQIVSALAPTLTKLTGRFTEFLVENRPAIERWATDFGEKLPARLERLGEVARQIFGGIRAVVEPVAEAFRWLSDKVGGAENAAKLLVGAFATFKGLQLVSHLGKIVTGLGGIASAALTAGRNLAAIKMPGALPGAAVVPGGGKPAAGGGLAALAGGPAALVLGGALNPAYVNDEQEDTRSYLRRRGGYGDQTRIAKAAKRWGAMLAESGEDRSRSTVGERVFGPPAPSAWQAARTDVNVTIHAKGLPPGSRLTTETKGDANVSTKNSPQLLPYYP